MQSADVRRGTRERVLADFRRVVDAEADAQGATRGPDITTYDSFP
ncbi:hypothetical protein ACFQ3Z_02760 [Streptomyces nogalater]